MPRPEAWVPRGVCVCVCVYVCGVWGLGARSTKVPGPEQGVRCQGVVCMRVWACAAKGLQGKGV